MHNSTTGGQAEVRFKITHDGLGLDYKITNHLTIDFISQYFLSQTFSINFNNIEAPRNYLSLGLSVGYQFN